MISTGESCFRLTSLASSEAGKRVISVMEEQVVGLGVCASSSEQVLGGMA